MVTELQAGDPRSAGRFRLLGRLGAGGMGQVFLGRSAGSRLVAVKVIRPDLAGDLGFRARFAREVAAAQKVSGLFTVLVVDADVDGPMPWLATAYVAGPSLAEAVEAHGPLPEASVLTLAAGGLAEGLEAIHAAGVVHRDLKPSNVLLADDGPRVIDFGISRAAEASALTHPQRSWAHRVMSPEQGEDQVGPGDVLAWARCSRSRPWARDRWDRVDPGADVPGRTRSARYRPPVRRGPASGRALPSQSSGSAADHRRIARGTRCRPALGGLAACAAY